MTTFALNKSLAEVLWEHAPDHCVRPEFVANLTAAQLRLFVETSIDADGSRSWSTRKGTRTLGTVISQREAGRLDAFEMACALLGVATSKTYRTDINMWVVQVKKRTYTMPVHTAKSGGTISIEKKIHDGMVWCPTTPSGTWLARRRGTVYFTGNSDRPYECYGRGGFLIHPGTYGLGEALGHVPGHDWNCGDWDALRFEIDRYLADPEWRERDRLRIAAEVRTNHTYTQRVQQMLGIVGLSSDG
jgi:hypothetical protein